MNVNKTNIKKRVFYKFNDRYFDKLNQNSAYLLGFIAADGSIYVNPKSCHYELTFRLSEKEPLDIIKKELQAKNPIHERLEKYSGINFDKYGGRLHKVYQLGLHSKKLTESLANLGIYQNKTFTIRYPSIPKNMDRHFIRGYFDGDGWITSFQNKDVKRATKLGFMGNKHFISEINQKIYDNINVKKRKLQNKNRIYYISYNGKLAHRVLTWMYDDAELFLSRKYDKWCKHKNGQCI